jgi:hypothetical protein
MDTHFMRDQVIKTSELTAETVKQGKTLMVFTIVTIIFVCLHRFRICPVRPLGGYPLFVMMDILDANKLGMQLPLSFMSSFFTIDIRQFSRDEDRSMSLDYVSAIICRRPYPLYCKPHKVPMLIPTDQTVPISAAISAIIVYFAFNLEGFSARKVANSLFGTGDGVQKK